MTPDQRLLHDFGEAIGTHDSLAIAARLSCSRSIVYKWRDGKKAMSGFARSTIEAHIRAIEDNKGE
jgi:hypothetical protein